MKKLILFTIILFTCIGLFGQNTFKYEIRANGGLTVPVSTFKIGVVTVTATGTQLNFVDATSAIQAQLNARLLKTDTATMLTPYILTSEVSTVVNDTVSISVGVPFIVLTPSASPPAGAVEGMIYMDTDHSLYVYNNSTWVKLDN